MIELYPAPNVSGAVANNFIFNSPRNRDDDKIDWRYDYKITDNHSIFLRHSYSFVHASYYARVRIQRDDHTIRFDLDRSRPHDIRDGRGFITLDRYGDDETIVTWGVMADVGSGILTGVFAPVIHDWILRVPWCVRGRMEPGQGTC